jgi:hypothetical protein
MKLKPKVFIGSSTEGKEIADAIDSGLRKEAEPTLWTAGVFGLSDSNLSSLMLQVRESDFGVFVFSADDTAEIRGKFLQIPRDNVVYELGLFSGALGPSRCFFVVPEDQIIHLPSDLLGITAGGYDAARSDENLHAALNPFCSNVKAKIISMGLRRSENEHHLLELGTRYECCEWIANEAPRVSKKDELWVQMRSFARGKDNLSKVALLKERRVSGYVAFAAAVAAQPSKKDCNLLLSINPSDISITHLQYKIVEAITSMIDTVTVSNANKHALWEWASKLPRQQAELSLRIATLKK